MPQGIRHVHAHPARDGFLKCPLLGLPLIWQLNMVIPTKAGIHFSFEINMDCRFRGNDGNEGEPAGTTGQYARRF
jgi:hypothetical protein